MSIKKSFTLIEMLIVVVIIGILAAALIPRLQSVQARARDTKRKADLHQIGTALAIYKEDNGNYNTLRLKYGMSNNMGTLLIADANHQTNENSYEFNTVLERYMTSIPMDPTLSTSWTDGGFDPINGYVLGLLPRHYHDPMNADTIPFDAMVLGSRTESDGSSSNRVSYGEAGASRIMTGDGTTRYGVIAGNDAGGGNMLGFHAQSYQDYMCTTVTLGTGLDNNGSGTCTARKDGDDLRYIYVQ